MNFIIFGGLHKNEYFLGGMKISWSSENLAILRGHFYAFNGLFERSRYRMANFFLIFFFFFLGGGGGW